MMVMREKVDVLQGILGALWLLTLIPIPAANVTILLALSATIIMLSATVVYLKEEGGLDIFGILSAVWSIVAIIFYLAIYLGPEGPLAESAVFIETYLGPISQLVAIILAIGLFLEAFDIIKPLKV